MCLFTLIITLTGFGIIFRWWQNSECPDVRKANADTKELTLNRVSGVFIFLACGVAIACIACLVEVCHRKRKGLVNDKKVTKNPAKPPIK